LDKEKKERRFFRSSIALRFFQGWKRRDILSRATRRISFFAQIAISQVLPKRC
jgi:hypothetical protein